MDDVEGGIDGIRRESHVTEVCYGTTDGDYHIEDAMHRSVTAMGLTRFNKGTPPTPHDPDPNHTPFILHSGPNTRIPHPSSIRRKENHACVKGVPHSGVDELLYHHGPSRYTEGRRISMESFW